MGLKYQELLGSQTPDGMRAARAAVERGAELLDTERPGWREAIDDDLLEMSSVHSCILGQTFRQWFEGEYDTYGIGVSELELQSKAPFDSPNPSAYFGFDSDPPNFDYQALGLAWEMELWPGAFKVEYSDLQAVRNDVQALRQELPVLVASSLREVFRNL